MLPAILSVALALAADPVPNEVGIRPVGDDGQPLNLDFETGTLKDWTAEGAAFKGQPIKGDAVAARRGDMKSRHQGEFWVGGYEKLKDAPQGTLTSVPFKVTHPWASFLVGGGAHPNTCVEIVNVARNSVLYRASGQEEEDMRRAVVDLTKLVGQQIQVRVVDRHSGGWGHVNFDDFRFHEKEPKFPNGVRRLPAALKPDDYKFAGQKPEDAAKAMTVPDGFTMSLFAGEPDVHQPVAMCTDDRGRLWVVEAYTYPRRHPHPGPLLPPAERKAGDKILIFEDTDGDGKFDKKTTFIEGLNLVSGIEYGFGGVWVGAAPYLLFIPHDAKTDTAGEPKILLDGWGYQDTHETLNAFVWGPDGWLYGCHGVFTYSDVGKPGAAAKDRTKINAGVWRYHPTRHVFEVFAHGTSNPWGLDYNAHGEFFISACVIPHMWHIVQGGRYQRQAGSHYNPYTFDDIKTIALHRHYLGATPHSGNNRSDSAGGGHAHCGLLCYQGGAWPKEYHGKLFMGNLHGHRLNVDVLRPKGSGYEADRNPDFLLSNDKWFIPVGLQLAPDGNVYLSDWSDKQVCHLPQPEKWDRTNGRVFKISYKGTKPVAGLDLQKCSDAELVKYQTHENQWYVRHARRILQERAAAVKPEAVAEMRKLAADDPDPVHRLRGLWALVASGQANADLLVALLKDKSEHVRGWVYRQAIGADNETHLKFTNSVDNCFGNLMLPNCTPVERRQIMSGLIANGQPDRMMQWTRCVVQGPPSDANDPLLRHLGWYLIEQDAGNDPNALLYYARISPGRIHLPFAARRVGAISTPEAIARLVKEVGELESDDDRLALLRGVQDGLKGRRLFPMPAGWPSAFAALAKSQNPDVRSQAQALAVVFGDKTAFDTLRKLAADPKADIAARQGAIATLVAAQDRELAPVLQGLVSDAAVRAVAVRGLAAFDDPKTPGVLLGAYPTFTAAEKRDAVATLAARVPFAKALMAAVGEKKVPPADVSAEMVRQLRNLQDAGIDKSLADLWGTVRESPAERKQLIESWRKKLTAKTKDAPDLSLGRAVFARTCQQCHTLYGVGGKVGPDITGSNRANLDYLLENVFDPSAVIPKDYAATRLSLADGRVVTGIVKEETKTALTVVTATEVLTIPAADVEGRKPSDLSMMPDDITKQVDETGLRALFAYLQHSAQVPVLATAENAKDFFNGKDLTGWENAKDLWRVENGEIVGKSPGLKRNEFLRSTTAVENFRLSVKVKLTPNRENSGIQFRSAPLANGEMIGPQADVGAGWWGKLYEESGRGLLWKESGEAHVKPEEWNEYVVEAVGPKVRTWINGKPCVDLEDDKLSRRGVVAFQLHSGGPLEVRFKDIRLEVLK